MAEMPDRINAAAMYDNPTHGVWDTAPEEGTHYIRADLVDELVKALEEARRDMRNAWGAVTSNQVDDKDVAGGLRAAMERIDAALNRIKETT